MEPTTLQVALVGNPNSGKSTLFNRLTGLRQSVSNFPGVTVDKKVGTTTLASGVGVSVIDLPGLYSLHANSSDERLVVDVLTNTSSRHYPDLVVYTADANNLERHLLLATQLIDLGLPMIFALNMVDLVENHNQTIATDKLEKYLQVPVIPISSRLGTNIDILKAEITKYIATGNTNYSRSTPIYRPNTSGEETAIHIATQYGLDNTYLAKIWAHHHRWLAHIDGADKSIINGIVTEAKFDDVQQQMDETMARYRSFTAVAKQTVRQPSADSSSSYTDSIDKIITHRLWGPLIFFGLMLFIFQAIYAWSEAPMTWIEEVFGALGSLVTGVLPAGWWTDLLVDGIIAGLGGVLVFVPQITILFFLIAILEETGYMSRAVFMFDGIMQKFGLNGRSIVALVSSGACAIPAIMSTRTIASWKERLNTIMVAPLISCSARIPVYTVLIGFAVPEGAIGIFSYRGLAFMGLYLLGIVGALTAALAFKYLLGSDSTPSYLMIELPQYKPPIWKNALLTVKEKVVTFALEAGKVILLISVILWFLASYGPSGAMEQAVSDAEQIINSQGLAPDVADDIVASYKIEASYAGHLGKVIEPVIKPLGFDWKIGIALITSFAAREVFVGTMATIYSVGSADDEGTVIERMATQVDPVTQLKVYNPATSLSLLIFYVFAMQCMSTLAVTKRETKSWKWPTIQLVYMTAIAYIGSLITYQLMSNYMM